MDLVYIPEVLTYGSFRSPQYRDYEQPWNKDYFSSYKKSSQQAQWQRPLQEPVQISKDNCHLCRETRRRSLAAYIRSKSRRDSSQGIEEEEEEKEEKKEARDKESNTMSYQKMANNDQDKSPKSTCDKKHKS